MTPLPPIADHLPRRLHRFSRCPGGDSSMPVFTQCFLSATSETPMSLAVWMSGFSQTSFLRADFSD